jgi:hypothetical protein
VGIAANKYVRGIETEEPLCKTDHIAVLLELHAPGRLIRAKPSAKLYPPPAFVLVATLSLNLALIEQLREAVADATANDSTAA